MSHWYLLGSFFTLACPSASMLGEHSENAAASGCVPSPKPTIPCGMVAGGGALGGLGHGAGPSSVGLVPSFEALLSREDTMSRRPSVTQEVVLARHGPAGTLRLDLPPPEPTEMRVATSHLVCAALSQQPNGLRHLRSESASEGYGIEKNQAG